MPTFFFFFLLLVGSASAATPSETEALLAFKAGISGDPRGALSSWTSTSGDPCQVFSGVTCSPPSGQVTKILLHSSSLTGDLPTSALSLLSSLRTLSLFNNSLTGDLPFLPSLFKLNLSRNAFSGSVPPGLGLLPSLRLLDLSHNRFSGPVPRQLFATCGRTRFVSLAHNSLSGPLPDAFRACRYLEGVDFSENGLSGGFPATLCSSPVLNFVSLGGNSLSGSVGKEVLECTSLERFDLGGNSFTGSVPFELLAMANMSYFNVSFNGFGGTIPSVQSCGNRVAVVDIQGNEIGGEIGTRIASCTELRVLNLGSNRLVGSIPAEIAGLRSLSVLRLGGNALITGGIPPELGAIELLVILDLHSMNLSGAIPAAISNLRFLLELNLSGNSLKSEIPPNIYNMTYLKILDLHRNQLTGGIPPSLGVLGGLEYLDLSENSLNGSIPDTLGGLTRLQSFNLSYNDLSGEIPQEENIQRFGASAFSHNAGLCGAPLDNVCAGERRSRRARLLSVSAIVAIVAAAAIVVGVCGITAVNLWMRRKKVIAVGGEEKEEEEEEVLVSESLTAASTDANVIIGKLVLFSKNLPSKYEDWETGTRALLDKDCIVGGGTIGTVYKASLEGGISVAVKKLETLGRIRSQDEFEQGISRLGGIRHSNLVEVQGYYWSSTMQLILMEFVPNGNLHQHLHNRDAGRLRWPQRFDIALGTARALAYLHHDCKPQILHLNIKAANILLDENCKPKLSDYGLVKLLPMLGNHGMSRFHSAAGYVAPELAAQSLSFSEKSDVYSFGVILLEVVTRRKPVERSGAAVMVLHDHVRRMLEGGNAADCLDRSLQGFAENELIQVLKLGLICTTDDPARRPSMAEVVQFLESIRPAGGSIAG